MDKTGRVVIPPQFSDSGHFSEGLAWASVLKERKWLYGFIDKSGKFIIEPQFVYQPGDFVDGLVKVMGQAQSGSTVFSQCGCDGCHVRSLVSGPSAVAALANKTYQPFSDFLVHDMGSLADNVPGNGDVGRNEMRTAPLWGLHLVAPADLLHDGRATSREDAILRHDGQAAAARAAFQALTPGHKSNLLAFLAAL
jgi:hypothetical protein